MPFHVCHFQYNVYVKNLFNTHYGLKCTGTIDVCFDFVNWTTTERGEKNVHKKREKEEKRKKANGKQFQTTTTKGQLDNDRSFFMALNQAAATWTLINSDFPQNRHENDNQKLDQKKKKSLTLNAENIIWLFGFVTIYILHIYIIHMKKKTMLHKRSGMVTEIHFVFS